MMEEMKIKLTLQGWQGKVVLGSPWLVQSKPVPSLGGNQQL